MLGPIKPIYVNGRFLAQPLSGVQRFAIETTAALGRSCVAAGTPRPIVLTPQPQPGGAVQSQDLAKAGIDLRVVGRLRGQVWEQIELPLYARDGVLLNLGNTASLRCHNQAVVIHDAGIYRSPETYSWRFKTWYRLMQSLLVRGRTKIITVSEFSRSEIVHFLGAKPGDIGLVTEGADHMQRIITDDTVLTRHNLKAGKFVVAVGNMAAHKNLRGLSQTAESLAVRGYDLVITGGLDTTVFNQRVDALPKPAKYVGRVSDGELRALYEAAAVFVFPSFYEGFGLPAVEAMTCRCLVVAADIPALREICSDAAIYCDPANPDDIALKVCSLLDHQVIQEQLHSAMRSRVAQYTWDATATGILNILSKL